MQRDFAPWVWRLLKWATALLLCVIALLPIWWMCNVVFAEAGSALSLSPRLYPTSLSGDSKTSARVGGWPIWPLAPQLDDLCGAGGRSGGAPGLRRGVRVRPSSLSRTEHPLRPVPSGADAAFGGDRHSHAACRGGSGLAQHDPGDRRADDSVRICPVFLTEYMRVVPTELIEAARMDGAGHARIFWSVALPVAWTGVVTIAVLTSSPLGQATCGRSSSPTTVACIR